MIMLGLLLLVGGAGALIINTAGWLDARGGSWRTRHRSPARRALVLTGTAAVVTGTALVWATMLAAP